MTEAVECRDVCVHYESVRAVDGLSLSVARGEMVALLGPSGSGKTTLLYAVAGFLPISRGEIALKGQIVATPHRATPPDRRRVGMVFQNYALWPHLTAGGTVAYPLRRAGMSRRDSLGEAQMLLELVGIGELADRKPGELSGGQQQRVGLARALAREADVYLFDEPTAHLDSPVRVVVQELIAQRRRDTGAGAIYATHDSAEALAIADRVAIMREGSIVQAGTPCDVYERPADVWAARLTGPASVFEVDRLDGGEADPVVELHGLRIPIEHGPVSHHGPVTLIVRPEWVTAGGPIRGEVRGVWFRGPHTDYSLSTTAGTLEARLPGPPTIELGQAGGWSITRGWVTPIES